MSATQTVGVCPNCGGPCEEYRSICNYCGFNKSLLSGTRCSHCGAELKTGRAKCEYCAYPISTVGRAMAVLREPTPSPAIYPITNEDPYPTRNVGKEILVTFILIAVTFGLVLAFSSALTGPQSKDVQQMLAQAGNAISALLGVLLFIAMTGVMLGLTKKL